MKKFTDKILHHGEHSETTEDRDRETERELEREKERHQKNVSFQAPRVTSPTKQHNFGTKVVETPHTGQIHDYVTTHEHPHEQVHDHAHAHEHVHEHINPPIVDTIVRPVVIEETVRRDKVIEVQPIIHRHIDAPEVHHIEKHLYEKVAPAGPARIIKQAVIDEVIQPHITEDITTVVHREVPAPYIVHEEQHITEHQVQPTVHTTEIIEEKPVIVGATKNVLQEERHTSDWEQQTVDRCPLALHERQLGVVEEKTTTTTTTTTKPVVTTLEENFSKVSLDKKEFTQQGVAAGGAPTQGVAAGGAPSIHKTI